MSEFDNDYEPFGWDDLAFIAGGVAVFMFALYVILT